MVHIRLISILLILSLFIAPWTAQAQEPRPLNNSMLQAELTSFVEGAMETYNVPGAAVALIQRGKTVYAQGFGTRSIDGGEPVTEETVFSVGSLTNGMTSLMIASLADEGLLMWDTPVVEIFPDFELIDDSATESVTLRDLLGMTSALPRLDLAWVRPGVTAESLLEGLTGVVLANRLVGEQFGYSPSSFAAGAYIATIAAGGEYGSLRSAYVDLMQARLFDPVYMLSATFDPEVVVSGDNYALPHDLLPLDEIVLTEPSFFPFGAPTVGVRANLADVARYVTVQIKEGIANPLGDRAVSKENLRETNRPHVLLSSDSDISAFLPGAANFGYGMGWYSANLNGMEVYFSPGHTAGFTSLAAFIPELNAGLVVLTNRGDADYFTFSVFNMLYSLMMNVQPHGVNQLQDNYEMLLEEQADIPFVSTFTAEDVGEYLGEYTDGWVVRLDEEAEASGEGEDEEAGPVGRALWLTYGDRAWRLVQVDIALFQVGTGWLRGSVVEFVDNDEGGFYLDITTPSNDYLRLDLVAAE